MLEGRFLLAKFVFVDIEVGRAKRFRCRGKIKVDKPECVIREVPEPHFLRGPTPEFVRARVHGTLQHVDRCSKLSPRNLFACQAHERYGSAL